MWLSFKKAKAYVSFRIYWLCNCISHLVIVCYLSQDDTHQTAMASDHCSLAFVGLVGGLASH